MTKSLLPPFPCPSSNLPAVLSARRMCALVLLTTCLGGAWTVEQPGGSLMEFFPTWRFVMQNLFRIGGPDAVRSSVSHGFPSAQTSEPIAVCEVSYCTLSHWSACVISSSIIYCSGMLHILANYISTLVYFGSQHISNWLSPRGPGCRLLSGGCNITKRPQPSAIMAILIVLLYDD